MADKGRVVGVTSILLSLLPVVAVYQCHEVLLCYLLISRKRQQVAMLSAAMEYNKALARKENHSTKTTSKKTRPVRINGGETYFRAGWRRKAVCCQPSKGLETSEKLSRVGG